MRMRDGMAALLLSICLAPLAGSDGPPAGAPAPQPALLYRNDFEKTEPGTVPSDFLVVGGEFRVEQDGANRLLVLPGEPLDSFGLVFGPGEKENLQVHARIRGTGKGRRFPRFGVGLNGITGFKLQVTPASRTLELRRGDAARGQAPFAWKSGAWTHLRLQLRRLDAGGWRVEGRAWTEGEAEPTAWLVTADETEEPRAGRPWLGGSPDSGEPIHFDDLEVAAVAGR
ncbi:MAG: hypothetical protein HYZ53_29745 [Planctomycetes bacterium]|nr:hypothetical protein [Planctomycetota bacterium]